MLAVALSVPVLATDAKSAKEPGADKDRLICRREVPVGSLIASRKVCLTKSQWEARARDGNEEARKMVYDNQGRPSGQ
jgi:hypothetical protein